MIIVIKKQAENRFIASVADPKITFISGEHEKNFAPFRNGIVAEGKTWGEAWINIKHQIDRYLNVYLAATGESPQFVKDGKATILSEGVVIDDLLK